MVFLGKLKISQAPFVKIIKKSILRLIYDTCFRNWIAAKKIYLKIVCQKNILTTRVAKLFPIFITFYQFLCLHILDFWLTHSLLAYCGILIFKKLKYKNWKTP